MRFVSAQVAIGRKDCPKSGFTFQETYSLNRHVKTWGVAVHPRLTDVLENRRGGEDDSERMIEPISIVTSLRQSVHDTYVKLER